jgi:hypothetical protein
LAGKKLFIRAGARCRLSGQDDCHPASPVSWPM